MKTPFTIALLLATLLASNHVSASNSTTSSSLWGSDQCDTVSCKYKAPNPQTSESLRQKWHQEDEALWKYVNEAVPAVLEHTGSAAFDEHLKGVQAVLRYWGAPDYLANAGLFHSIYGTEGFQGFSIPLSERQAIRSLIGPKAEKLAFIFCMVDRLNFDETVFAWQEPIKDNTTFKLRARPELGRFDMELTKDEWLDFVELTLADWMEQVEGAAAKPNKIFLWKTGQAYSYRRTAYKKMSEILAAERAPRLTIVAPQMLKDVMATEASETQNLLQMRTPPMSKASADALAALRAAGEAIPEDLSPKPMEECLQQ